MNRAKGRKRTRSDVEHDDDDDAMLTDDTTQMPFSLEERIAQVSMEERESTRSAGGENEDDDDDDDENYFYIYSDASMDSSASQTQQIETAPSTPLPRGPDPKRRLITLPTAPPPLPVTSFDFDFDGGSSSNNNNTQDGFDTQRPLMGERRPRRPREVARIVMGMTERQWSNYCMKRLQEAREMDAVHLDHERRVSSVFTLMFSQEALVRSVIAEERAARQEALWPE